MCQEQDLFNEIGSLRHDLQLSSYPKGFIYWVISSKGSGRPSKKEKSLGSLYISYVKGVSEKLKYIGNTQP
jgi:hypothetical protein